MGQNLERLQDQAETQAPLALFSVRTQLLSEGVTWAALLRGTTQDSVWRH